jgi:hypothetical protein
MCRLLQRPWKHGYSVFELLDDSLSIVGTLTMRDFIEALEEQKKAV